MNTGKANIDWRKIETIFRKINLMETSLSLPLHLESYLHMVDVITIIHLIRLILFLTTDIRSSLLPGEC